MFSFFGIKSLSRRASCPSQHDRTKCPSHESIICLRVETVFGPLCFQQKFHKFGCGDGLRSLGALSWMRPMMGRQRKESCVTLRTACVHMCVRTHIRACLQTHSCVSIHEYVCMLHTCLCTRAFRHAHARKKICARTNSSMRAYSQPCTYM